MRRIINTLTIIALVFTTTISNAASTTANGTIYQQRLKKDGTPDKRYKDNSVKGPMKKDGTPDMRYRANKNASAAKPTAVTKTEKKTKKKS